MTEGVKIDLYTLDHSVREVDKTFTQLGWHLDENRPNPSALDEPATVRFCLTFASRLTPRLTFASLLLQVATATGAMRLLERYYQSYEPNELCVDAQSAAARGVYTSSDRLLVTTGRRARCS